MLSEDLYIDILSMSHRVILELLLSYLIKFLIHFYFLFLQNAFLYSFNLFKAISTFFSSI